MRIGTASAALMVGAVRGLKKGLLDWLFFNGFFAWGRSFFFHDFVDGLTGPDKTEFLTNDFFKARQIGLQKMFFFLNARDFSFQALDFARELSVFSLES
jgi:hypothetical protein